MPGLPRPVLQRNRARSRLQRAHAGGQPGLRELPRPWQEARGERRPGAHQELHGRWRRRRSARPAPRATTGRRTRSGTAASTISGTSAASTCHSVHAPKGDPQLKAQTPDGALQHVSPQRRQQAVPLQPHAGAGRRADVLVVPQRARQHQRQAAPGRHDDRRELHELPRGQARTVPVGARAGHRELRHLPRPARIEQRPDAREQAAVPLPAMSRHVAPSAHGLRRVPAEELAERQQDLPGGPAPSATSMVHGSNAPSGKALLR